MIRIALFLAAFFLCAWYAFKAGGRPERLAMLAQGLALLLTLATGFLTVSGGFWKEVPGWLAADALLLMGLTWLALRANRLWPIVLAGLQLATMFAHLAKALYPHLPALGYAVLLQMWAWPMLLTTAIGVRAHQLRERRHRSVPDWKPSLPPRAPALH
jgi:hypothetical protein